MQAKSLQLQQRCSASSLRRQRAPFSSVTTPLASRQPTTSSLTCCSSQLDDQQTRPHQHLPHRALFSSLAAAALLLSTGPTCSAEEIYAAGPSTYAYPAAERYATQQEARFDELLQTTEVRELLTLLQKGGYSLEQLDAARLKVGFQRSLDGRVSLRGQDGRWFSIKNDMQSPGFVLVRDQSDGRVLFLPPDESGRLMQIDLSDDAIVAQLFGSGAWQDVMEPLRAEDMQGKIVPLVLEEQDFRNTMSLLEDAVEQQEQ